MDSAGGGGGGSGSDGCARAAQAPGAGAPALGTIVFGGGTRPLDCCRMLTASEMTSATTPTTKYRRQRATDERKGSRPSSETIGSMSVCAAISLLPTGANCVSAAASAAYALPAVVPSGS